MTDFDERLRARLERLDAAIPAPRPPAGSAVEGPLDATAGARPSGPGRKRKVALLLAAAALLVATSVVTAERVLFPDVPQPALEVALEEVFAESDCIQVADAREWIQARLDALGYADWSIESAGGAEDARCVVAGLMTVHHVVLLLPAVGRDVIEAMDGVREGLMRRCLGREEAIQFVSSVLTGIGASDVAVRADPRGPQGGPIGQFEAIRSHVAAGCFVYSGMPDGSVHLWGRH